MRRHRDETDSSSSSISDSEEEELVVVKPRAKSNNVKTQQSKAVAVTTGNNKNTKDHAAASAAKDEDGDDTPAREDNAEKLQLPTIGLGTFRLKGKACTAAVELCIRKGVRLIDTANSYKNHAEIVEGIKRAGVVALSDVIIISKISKEQLGGSGAPEANVKAAVANEAKLLGKVPDVMLLHWPGTATSNTASQLHKNARIPAWRALLAEKAKTGGPRLVGVSNFTVAHLRELVAAGCTLPDIVQDEFHPFCQQRELRDFCEENKIIFQPYTSLGRALAPPACLYGNDEFPRDEKLHPRVASHSVVKETAKALGVSEVLLLLRYATEKCGGPPIPKMSSEEHIDENLKAVDEAFWAEKKKKAADGIGAFDIVKILDAVDVPLPGKTVIRYAYQPKKFPQ